MKKRILLFCLLASLLYLPGLAQISFGVKVGGSYLPGWDSPTQGYEFVRNSRNTITMDPFEPGVNVFTNNPELLVELDSFSHEKTQPISMEIGAYFSIPISQRSRIRLEIAYHEYNFKRSTTSYRTSLGSVRIKQPDSFFVFRDNSGYYNGSYYNYGSAVILNGTTGQFLRPSLHFHNYFSKNFAFNLGVALSLPIKEINVQGFSYAWGSVEEGEIYYSDPTGIFYQLADRIEKLSGGKKLAIPSINAGFLLKLGGLPKIEVRGSYYFPALVANHLIRFEEKEFQLPTISEPLKYTPGISFDDSFALSVFLEL